MNYTDRKRCIGNRIKKERESLGLSRGELLTKIYKSESSHKTLAAWEKGERLPDLDSLALMADLFDCDMGYLLGDYEERHYIAADICGKTKLSESAINNLLLLAKSESNDDFWADTRNYLSFLLEHSTDFLVNPVINVSKYVDASLMIRHYKDEVLPMLQYSPEYNQDIWTWSISEKDAEIRAKKAKVYNEIRRLQDVCTANRYYSEKAAASAISDFIDYLEKQCIAADEGRKK